MRLKFKNEFIEAFYPYKELWQPEVFDYYNSLRHLDVKPEDHTLPLSERINKVVHIFRKNNVSLISPRSGNDGGYYFTYDGLATYLDEVNLDMFKALLPLADHISFLRTDGMHRGIFQIIFEYRILKSTNSLIEHYMNDLWWETSWMKKIKLAEKFDILKHK